MVTRVTAALLVTMGVAACGSVVDGATAPTGAAAPQLNVALATEVGPALACGTSAPVTVTATTTDRRGKVVPAVGVVLNFRAMNAYTDLFAGAAATNAAGQASDRVTAGVVPGRPIALEVRSVEAGTGIPTTHLALTRPVVVAPTATLKAFTAQVINSISTILFSVVKINTGCVGADGKPVNLPSGTKASFARPNAAPYVTDLIGDAAAMPITEADVGKTITVTVGDASTGTLVLTYVIEAVTPTTPGCTTLLGCLSLAF